jgi:imidazole glycerol-phosphate synthase subunit HisF
MLRQRIIFTLIYDDGFFCQSRNFRLQRVGDIKWLENNYKFQKIAFSIDELIIVNATRGKKNLSKFTKILDRLVDNVYIPISAGGGISSLEDAKLLFNHGADKLIINTALFRNTNLISNIVKYYGKQSIIASIDYRDNEVFISDGKEKVGSYLEQYIKHAELLGVGEIYLNSIKKDGTGFGFDLNTIEVIAGKINIPLIVAGGAGNQHHLLEAVKIKGVSAVATANLFNFIGESLPKARQHLIQNGANLVEW